MRNTAVRVFKVVPALYKLNAYFVPIKTANIGVKKRSPFLLGP